VQTSPRAASQLWRLASPSKVRRLRHGGADGEFYDDASVRQRVQLKQHPRVQAALARLWDAANTDSRDHVLDRAEYGVMHRKMLLALRPMIGPREALRSAEEDWAADAEGEAVKAIDRPKFEWALFELADLWTDSVSASEYADFCDRMLRLITTRDAAGRARWRGDEEIVRLRYRETKPTVDDNLQAALALWSGWWRAQRKGDGRHRSVGAAGGGAAARPRRPLAALPSNGGGGGRPKRPTAAAPLRRASAPDLRLRREGPPSMLERRDPPRALVASENVAGLARAASAAAARVQAARADLARVQTFGPPPRSSTLPSLHATQSAPGSRLGSRRPSRPASRPSSVPPSPPRRRAPNRTLPAWLPPRPPAEPSL
jgi:hypothetical protein